MDYYLDNIVIYRKMIRLESKMVYDSLHILHLVSHMLHTSVWVYVYVCVTYVFHGLQLFTYRWYRSYIDLVDFYNFKYLILYNYLSDFNETYIHYRGVCIDLIYQFSDNSMF